MKPLHYSYVRIANHQNSETLTGEQNVEGDFFSLYYLCPVLLILDWVWVRIYLDITKYTQIRETKWIKT